MKLSRPVLINSGLAVVIVGALVAGGIFLFGSTASGDPSSENTRLTATVQQGSVSQTVSASGAVAPTREVAANFAVTGTVATVDVAVGQTVTVGQILGTLATGDLQNAVDQAWLSYANAKENLAAAQGGPVEQVNSAEEAKQRAWNEYESAKADLASATLTSPIAGLVTAVNGTVGGSSAGAGAEGSASSFVTIADVSAYVVTANIAEADIAEVAVGQAATVTFPALSEVTATAKVTAVAPTATTSNAIVTYSTTMTLDEVPESVRLGQTAEVGIVIVSSAEDALYVPSAAITTAADGSSTVDVVDPETDETTTVTVETGVVGDEGTEIVSGLELGDTIVLGIATTTDDSGTGSPTGGGPEFGTGGPVIIDGGPPVRFEGGQ